ncbi:peroxiredoxin [Advenella mimigardefordensis]|uniref:thioredoxin-dependent peroxiredoxin n=1 Tax=Advenella mimigardefordensis (strain DSM 17166 / LMG 22922 / DPN7) TaxID=1247726 RepID=W0PDT5_ADVMD|nr:peroxiredoxin [Advenella mimigardefordensis]AHG63580.1 putative peroxidase [Advenella mimigardefordensis DPN7]
MTSPPTVGKKVPAFKAESQLGPVSLTALKGKNVVLYFYPKDNTPGCTTETQGFRDALSDFESENTVILGVSRDSLKSHENFATKQNVTFALLSDADEALCTQFDVIKMKNMYGKQVRGIERSTFLIDEAGKLVQEWRKVKVPGHVDAVLDAVRNLNAAKQD